MKNAKKTLLAIIAVTVTAGVLWFTHMSAGPPKKATWADVVAEAQKVGYRLITTNDLWKQFRQNRESLLLVDTRQEWEFRTGHITGAVNFPMEPTWLAKWQKKGDLGRFLGHDKDRAIVFY